MTAKKSDAEHQKNGSWRGAKNPSRRKEPIAPKGEPIKPDWLTGDHELRVWSETVARCRQTGVLSTVDADAIAAYASTFAQYIRLQESLNAAKELGLVETTESGRTVVRAEVRAMPSLLTKIIQYQGELGLTPKARGKVHRVADAPNDDGSEDDQDYFAGPPELRLAE